jgi:hypothetical protein
VSTTPVSGATPEQDLASSDRWTDSTERSRARRITAAIKRRRRLRSRGAVLSLAAVLALSATGAGLAGATTGSAGGGGASTSTYLAEGSSGPSVSAVEQALGLEADGYFDGRTTKAVRGFQSDNGLTVDGIVGPETSAALGLSANGASSGSTGSGQESAGASQGSSGGSQSGSQGGGSTANGTLEGIAQCESGGDPSAVSSDGQYRGKYQFTRETWQANGGSGDPAWASEAEQDRVAQRLYSQSGASSWPSCG